MLHKSKSKKINQLKYALVIPIVALFLMGFNTEEVYVNSEVDSIKATSNISNEELIISGTVTNDKGEAIPGVTVIVKEKNTGSITDSKGNYKIKVNKGENLIFSYVGMVSQIIMVENNDEIDVKLSGKLFQNLKSTGKAEKNILTSTFSLISDPENPLYIIDGEEVSANIVKALNPDSIESMTVLKDEEAIKKYGDKGKNGVIEIKMKAKWETKFIINGDVKVAGYGIKHDTIKIRSNYIEIHDDKPNTVTYRITGNSTANGETPLIVVDGKESPQEKLNPDKIESMTVLKAETATKKYGDKGKNGVIEITTKK